MTAPTSSPAPGAPADAGTGGQAPTGTQPPTAPQQQTGQAPDPQQGTSSGQQDIASLPDWAQKIITETRAEAAKHRTEKLSAAQQAQEAQQQRDAVLAALGLAPDGTNAPPDPATLTAQIEQAQATAWANAVELTVTRTALAAGVDAERLLDSRAFIDSLDEFTDEDPTSPEFRTKLDAHIQAYVAQHPAFKATPGVPRPDPSQGAQPGGSLSYADQAQEALAKGDVRAAIAYKAAQLTNTNN